MAIRDISELPDLDGVIGVEIQMVNTDVLRLEAQLEQSCRAVAAVSRRCTSTASSHWASYPDAYEAIIERLQGVIIERRGACKVMVKRGAADTLHHVEPPYFHEPRCRAREANFARSMYRRDMSRCDHPELLAFLADLKDMVLLSGYPDRRYDVSVPDWRRHETKVFTDGAHPAHRSPVTQPGRRCPLDAKRLTRFQSSA